MSLRHALFVALAVSGLAVARSATAAGFRARNDHGARLEPKGGVLHGAGQDPAGFRQAWNVLGEGARPAFYMHYLRLDASHEGSLAGLDSQLLGYERDGVHLLVQLGLSMTEDGKPWSHYEAKVAAGEYDVAIEALCDELEMLGRPVLLRIGYEFNATAFFGYAPKSYVAAFRRITERLRARQLEVATVWDAAGERGSLLHFMQFYPGDEYVDWWGLNLFSGPKGAGNGGLFFGQEIARFLDAAEEHKKPVIIGEATPRYTGVGEGQKSWDLWFADFFELVARRPGIKAVSYINWNWARYPHWNDWGDARLEADPVVAGLYRAVVSAPPFVSGGDESRMRSVLGLPPRQAQPEPPAAPPE